MNELSAPASSSTEPTTNQESTNQAQESEARKPQPPKRQYIDLDGEQVDIEELKRERKKFKGADKAFREAAQARKEVEQFYRALQEDPESILSDPRLPIKKRELAEKWLLEQLTVQEPEDPRDIELMEYKQKLEEYERREQEELTRQEREQYRQVVEQRKQHFDKVFSEAMQMSPLSRKDETKAETLREMAVYYRLCRQAGYEPSPDELAQHVESRYMTSFRTLVDHLEGEDLVKVLGDSLIKKLRKYDLEQLQKARMQPAPEVAQDYVSAYESGGQKKRQIINPDDLRRQYRK